MFGDHGKVGFVYNGSWCSNANPSFISHHSEPCDFKKWHYLPMLLGSVWLCQMFDFVNLNLRDLAVPKNTPSGSGSSTRQTQKSRGPSSCTRMEVCSRSCFFSLNCVSVCGGSLIKVWWGLSLWMRSWRKSRSDLHVLRMQFYHHFFCSPIEFQRKKFWWSNFLMMD